MQKNYWLIKCNHTPETVDKIMLSFRKRGMMVDMLHYRKITEDTAECEVDFEDTPESAERIRKNILRLVDINEIGPMVVA